jgi:hypothetical protein
MHDESTDNNATYRGSSADETKVPSDYSSVFTYNCGQVVRDPILHPGNDVLNASQSQAASHKHPIEYYALHRFHKRLTVVFVEGHGHISLLPIPHPSFTLSYGLLNDHLFISLPVF